MAYPHSQPGNASELLPCPFCGVSDAFVERSDFSSAYVMCNHCSAQGPCECQESDDEETPGKSAAELSWNTRIDNPSLNAVTGSSGTHPVPEGAADNAPPAIQVEIDRAVMAELARQSEGGVKYLSSLNVDDLVATICTVVRATPAAEGREAVAITKVAMSGRPIGRVCCYCDAPLSCGVCGMEQPDDPQVPSVGVQTWDAVAAARRQERKNAIEECARCLDAIGARYHAAHLRSYALSSANCGGGDAR